MPHLKITAIFLFLSISIAYGQDNDLHQQLHQMAKGYQSVFGFSGNIKVVQGGKEIFEQSYGLANRSFGIENTPQTRFSINSISKTFTATAILMLARDQKIDLQVPIKAYLPELNAPWKDTVTVHHLLSHTSGLPRESGIQACDELSFMEQLKLVETKSLLFSPGKRFEYSNCGLILLGAILEKVSNRPYEDFIQQEIIEPLGLTNTGCYQGRNVVARQAVPYRFSANGLETAQRSKHFGDNAGGGLYSTAGDLYKYVLGLEAQKLLPETYTALLFQPHVQSGETDFEGYAWSIKKFGGEKIHFAAGSGYGTKSVIIRMPDSGNYIGITSNWGNTPILQLLRDLYLTLIGAEAAPPAENVLANPRDYATRMGEYKFDQEQLTRHLGMDRAVIRLHAFEGKLFLNDELLAEKEGTLMLTYTNELRIQFEGSKMIININGNIMEGQKLQK
jgi:CubicO group peptidase (beta-lactamase class C family)